MNDYKYRRIINNNNGGDEIAKELEICQDRMESSRK
jgi:hypothetical protein